MNEGQFAKVWAEAKHAYVGAYMNASVKKVLVGQAVGFSNQIDYSKPVDVMDGLCGFAWIEVGDGRSAWAKWLKKNNYARKGVYGGVTIWSSSFGEGQSQSVERKEAGCQAAAAVFRKYGLSGYACSRLD